MIGKEKLLSFLKQGLRKARFPQTEIFAYAQNLRAIRFANSTVHQPMEETNVNFGVKVIRNGKIGYASVNGLDLERLANAVQEAETSASLPQALPYLESFAEPKPIEPVNSFSRLTDEAESSKLVDKVKLMFKHGNGTGGTFAGILWSVSGETGVLNTNGVELYHPFTAVNCQAVFTKEDLSGFSAQAASDLSKIDPEKIADASVHRALRFKEAHSLPPGEYTCLLDEYATAELLLYLAYIAFSAEAVETGSSIIGLKQGEKIADSKVTISDNAYNPLTFQSPFDVEGVPRKKVVFIDRGIAKSVVHDRFTAHKFKTESTGHAVPFDFSEGPLPLNLEMAEGESSKEELLKQIKRGLLITRFHYIRVVHPLKTMVTGMTRDGVFLVENGEIVSRIKNFRFTEGILNAFSKVKAVSKNRKLVTFGEVGFPAGILAPKVLTENFSFTGTTHF
jgi:predicted Zn-dependent protease